MTRAGRAGFGEWDGAPVAVYTQLTQQIRSCWFTPGTSKLTNHGFHAEVSPKDSNNAKIILYEKDPQGKRGVRAFRINISGGGSTVRSKNRRLDKTLDVAFKADLARRPKGNQGCKGSRAAPRRETAPARNFDNFAIYESDGEYFGYRGTGLRKAVIGLLCLAALLLSGCAKKDPAVARVEGSEPRRLSFGAPAAVQKSFTDQMKICWFNGPSALLGGYQYDAKPSVMETADGLVELQQVSISSGQGPQAQIFIIQFHAFNENTLISTRNLSFPVELAARLKRDVETWIFGGGECKEAAPPAGYAGVPALAPQSPSVLRHAWASGWSPK